MRAAESAHGLAMCVAKHLSIIKLAILYSCTSESSCANCYVVITCQATPCAEGFILQCFSFEDFFYFLHFHSSFSWVFLQKYLCLFFMWLLLLQRYEPFWGVVRRESSRGLQRIDLFRPQSAVNSTSDLFVPLHGQNAYMIIIHQMNYLKGLIVLIYSNGICIS